MSFVGIDVGKASLDRGGRPRRPRPAPPRPQRRGGRRPAGRRPGRARPGAGRAGGDRRLPPPAAGRPARRRRAGRRRQPGPGRRLPPGAAGAAEDRPRRRRRCWPASPRSTARSCAARPRPIRCRPGCATWSPTATRWWPSAPGCATGSTPTASAATRRWRRGWPTTWPQLEARLADVEAATDRPLAELPEAAVLLALPGVGPRVAAAALAYLPRGDLGRRQGGGGLRRGPPAPGAVGPARPQPPQQAGARRVAPLPVRGGDRGGAA